MFELFIGSVSGWPDHFLDVYTGLPEEQQLPITYDQHHTEDEFDLGRADPGDSKTIALLKSLKHRMECMTYSTAFSGIDSPGTAFAQLRAAVNHALDAKSKIHPEHIHAIDPKQYL